MTRSDVGKGHPEYYQDMAERIAEETRRLLRQPVRQPGEPARARDDDRARRSGRRWASDVDAVVCGVGSGGTITGLSRYLRAASRRTSRWCSPIRPARCSPTTSKTGKIGEAGSWLVEGIGEDFVPPICDLSRVRTRLLDPRRGELRHGARAAARRRASWPAPRRARWSPPRCATAASRRRRSASSPSSATAATSTCRRCSTTTGWRTRASCAATRTAICAT